MGSTSRVRGSHGELVARFRGDRDDRAGRDGAGLPSAGPARRAGGLGSLRGRPVVLYFFPRDAGRGCTIQACGVRDRWEAFVERGASVLGISADDVNPHARFAGTHGLPRQLLADPQHQVIEAYGAWGWRTKRGGTRELGVRRDTVLLGGDGRVAGIWREVDPETHVEVVLAALVRLGRGPTGESEAPRTGCRRVAGTRCHPSASARCGRSRHVGRPRGRLRGRAAPSW
jgi:thioredoxin-dependent peroxiredoxin